MLRVHKSLRLYYVILEKNSTGIWSSGDELCAPKKLSGENTAVITYSFNYIILVQPPIFINLPDSTEISEDVVEEVLVYELDIVDQSENDSVCCTLTEVIPGSLNFQLKFENQCK